MKPFFALLASLCILCAAPTAAIAALEGEAIVVIARLDDRLYPEDAFGIALDLRLDTSTSAPVLGGQLTIAGGDPIILERDDDGTDVELSAEDEFVDLAALKSGTNGVWEITLDMGGIPDVVASFTLNAAVLTEGDIFQTPMILNPVHAERGVDADVTFQWTDPTGPVTPHVLIVEADNETDFDGDVEDNSLEGGLLKTDTSWNPGLIPGNHEFSVQYFAAGESFISAIATTSGTITWNLSGFAPAGYPATKPLLAVGSESIIRFGTPLVDTFEYAVQTDTTGIDVDLGGSNFVRHYMVKDNSNDVASVSRSLAEAASITASVGDSAAWGLRSGAGVTGALGGLIGFVLAGDLPAFSDATRTGPFADFFGTVRNSPEPKQMWDAHVSVSARDVAANPNSHYRVLMMDVNGNEVASDPIELQNAFETHALSTPRFNFLVSGGFFDFNQVTGLRIALFTTPGETNAVEMHVGDVSVEFLPEPGSGALAFAAIATLFGIARRKRT